MVAASDMDIELPGLKRRKREVVVTSVISYRPVSPAQASILLVEDDSDHFITEVKMIAACGVMGPNIHWKVSGQGVIQYADVLPPLDVILLDIGLPHEDGYAILKKLRTTKQFRRTLVVAVSGRNDEMGKAKKAGFDSFIGKPLQMDRFPGQLTRILSGEQVWEDR